MTQRSLQRGMSLVELMIGLLLGLLVVAVCGRVYLSTSATTLSGIALARVQEGGRLAVGLLGRDLRGAGDLVCDNSKSPFNLMAERESPFWVSLGEPVRGTVGDGTDTFFAPFLPVGTGPGDRLSGTDALRLWRMRPLRLAVAERVGSDAPLPVTGPELPAPGSPLLVCDFQVASIVRVTAGRAAVGHAAPANCIDHFSAMGGCASAGDAPGAWHRHGTDTAFAVPEQVRWFVAAGTDGSPTLTRAVVIDGVVVTQSPVVGDVDRFELTYLADGAERYVTASQIDAGGWSKVIGARVHLVLRASAGRGAADNVVRPFQQTFQIRSRTP